MSIWCFLVEMCGYSEKCTRPDPWFVSRTRTLTTHPDPPDTGTTRGPVPAGYTRYPLGSITTGVHSCHSTEIEMMIILLFCTANDLLHMVT